MDWRKLGAVFRDLGPVAVGAGALLASGVALSVSSSRRRRYSYRGVSVWWDVVGSATIRYLEAHIRNLKALGVSSVCVMYTDLDGTTNFTDDEIVRFASALRASGISMGIDVWAYPTERFLAWVPTLIGVVTMTGASFVEFDIEMNWTDERADGRSNLDSAAYALATAMIRCPVPWGITTNTGRLTADAVTLGKYGKFIAPQAYSVFHADDPTSHQPGTYQRGVYRKTRDTYGPGIEIVMGLPAYGQEGFTGIEPKDAMVLAASTSFSVGAKEIRFWSWKWIGGHDGTPRNRYAYNALVEIQRRFA